MLPEGIWQSPQPRFSHLDTADYVHTNLEASNSCCNHLAHKRCLPPPLPLLFFALHTPTLQCSSSTYIPLPSSVCIPLTAAHCFPDYTCLPFSSIQSCTDIAYFPHILPLFCLVSLSFFPLSLLGDPLVTSSLLQLPWFQGQRHCNNCLYQTEICCIFYTKNERGLRYSK